MSKNLFEFVKIETPCFNQDLRYSGKPYIKYGADNNYPTYIKNFSNISTTHKACLDLKQTVIAGEGFTNASSSAQTFLNSLDWETSNSTFLEKISKDLTVYNGFAIEVIYNQEEEQKIISAKQYPFENFRSGKPNKRGEVSHYYYNNDWLNYENQYVKIPAFGVIQPPVTNKDGKILKQRKSKEIIYCFMPNILSNYYPSPCYDSALNWIKVEEQLGVHHLSCTANNFLPSMAVTFFGDFDEKANRDLYVDELKQNHTGVDNSANMFVFFAQNREQKPEFDPLSPTNIVDVYESTAERAKQEIVTANKISSPSLLAISRGDTTVFSNPDEIINEFKLWSNTTIRSYQKQIERNVNMMLKHAGFENEDIKIIPFDPLKNLTVQENKTTTDGLENV